MDHTFKINNYEELKACLKDITLRYCKICKEMTYHLKCGINERQECLKHEN